MKDDEFDRLLKTTRLKLSPDEKSKMKKDIDEIIGYFDKIDKIRTEGEPAYQPIYVPSVFREDKVRAFSDIDALKKPSKLHKGYILGPKL